MKRAVNICYAVICLSTFLACQPASPDRPALLHTQPSVHESVSTPASIPSASPGEVSDSAPAAATVDNVPAEPVRMDAASMDPAVIPSGEVAAFDPNPIPGEDAASLTANASRYPICGLYYGTVFQCGNYLCAKSDPAYQNICTLASTSRPANGGKTPTASTAGQYPVCGKYYGTVYQCGSNLCAKSDSNYQNPCTIGPNSSPANGGSTPTQTSGSYPLCPATGYYGSTFQCGNQICAKSDPNYQNMCVVTSNSKPVGSSTSSSGTSYPLCGSTYYGSLFQCGTRTCAKSDPNYQNICIVR